MAITAEYKLQVRSTLTPIEEVTFEDGTSKRRAIHSQVDRTFGSNTEIDLSTTASNIKFKENLTTVTAGTINMLTSSVDIVQGEYTVVLSNTTNIYPGKVCVKTAGAGEFGVNAQSVTRVTEVDHDTKTLTLDASHATAGDITFTVEGGLDIEYLFNDFTLGTGYNILYIKYLSIGSMSAVTPILIRNKNNLVVHAMLKHVGQSLILPLYFNTNMGHIVIGHWAGEFGAEYEILIANDEG